MIYLASQVAGGELCQRLLLVDFMFVPIHRPCVLEAIRAALQTTVPCTPRLLSGIRYTYTVYKVLLCSMRENTAPGI